MPKVINLFEKQQIKQQNIKQEQVKQDDEEITVTTINSDASTEDIKAILKALFNIEE